MVIYWLPRLIIQAASIFLHPPFKIEIIPKSKMGNKIGNTFLIPSMRETEGGYQPQ